MEKFKHAYLIVGSREQTPARAQELAAALLCEGTGKRPCGKCRQCRKVAEKIHPDVTIVDRVAKENGSGLNREILVKQIRDLSRDASVLPNDAAAKVYIFPAADDMNPQSQNAFLKLLEEPPQWVTFILCTENADRLLPTVRSRCSALHSGKAAETETPVPAEAEEFFSVFRDPFTLWKYTELRLSKLDAERMNEVVNAVCTEAPKRVSDPRELLALEKFLEHARQCLRANLGPAAVSAYIATYVYDRK